MLDPNGNLLNETSILDALQQSKFSPVLYQKKLEGDITHTNAIELVDVGKANPASPFRNGQILLSMHSINFVGLLDIKTQRFVWGESDFWAKQHQPTLLDNGNILLFDNQGSFKQSKVIEYNPITRTIQWCYGCSEDEKFYTSVCGSCQRLPNGNTLIIESEPGRAFEVTHVQRRVNLRTDRRIVLRTCAYTFPCINLRLWLIRSLRDSFFRGMIYLLYLGKKTGNLVVVEIRQQPSIEVLKRFLMWHPPLLKSTNKLRGGMDATIEAYTR